MRILYRKDDVYVRAKLKVLRLLPLGELAALPLPLIKTEMFGTVTGNGDGSSRDSSWSRLSPTSKRNPEEP